jgi:Tol biopolymer transport system component
MPSRIAAVLASTVLFMLATLATPADAAFPGKNGKIAFVTSRDDIDPCQGLPPDPEACAHERESHETNTEIYTVNPDGSGETRLTYNGHTDAAPAWSPDGSKAAFARHSDSWEEKFAVGSNDLFTMNADGSGQTNLTNTPHEDFDESDPAWSPDGQKIAFLRTGYARLGPSGIYVMNPDGSGQTFLTAGSEFSQPAWSPDGTKIAFVNTYEIHVMNADGTDATRLTTNADGVYDYSPDWSPDGTKIAFTRLTPNTAEIVTMNADGTGQTILTNSAAHPAWSPDGSKIAFTRFTPNAEIFTMNADGTGQTRVTTAGGSAPDWQPIPEPKRGDYKNAAKFCEADRTFWGDADFAKKYGTNGSASNAYGKCVSQNK